MPRKRTRSGRESGNGELEAKSKQVKKSKVSQSRAKRIKRQLAVDEKTVGVQHKDDGEVTKGEVEDVSKRSTPSQFKFERILSENPTSKSVAVFGRFPSDSKGDFAVILAEKMAFTKEAIEKLFMEDTTFTHNFQNDIYGQYTSDAGIKLTVINPATEKHVNKYTQQSSVIVQENATAYATKIRPYAETQALSLQVHLIYVN